MVSLSEWLILFPRLSVSNRIPPMRNWNEITRLFGLKRKRKSRNNGQVTTANGVSRRGISCHSFWNKELSRGDRSRFDHRWSILFRYFAGLYDLRGPTVLCSPFLTTTYLASRFATRSRVIQGEPHTLWSFLG